MSVSAHPRARRAASPGMAAGAAALGALALAVAGAVLALAMIDAGRRADALAVDASLAPRGPAAIAQDVPTSFGVVAVESMTKSAGPTARALAGVTHGIQNLVRPDRLQVDVTVTMTNLRATVLRYTPAQFTLYATRGREPRPGERPVRLSRASVAPGVLQPEASVDATLTYVAPRDGSKLWIAFRDRGRDDPILFDLGRVDRTPPQALDRDHVHAR